ncbi:hypothetical protein JYG23_08660 [Sedimentibacter sp. zth1]|uniref:hypothetical protein n=1 Tax=Sedimentibacter sp. zth1 TaxID=2816908 RepID=UPI001A93A8A9|nr:hypothetical protein [Sedimentibacter sp. zth1]QSX04778.1 hypothetical protein JYG23_08660 [Sedimentibacter sp. zth1]
MSTTMLLNSNNNTEKEINIKDLTTYVEKVINDWPEWKKEEYNNNYANVDFSEKFKGLLHV